MQHANLAITGEGKIDAQTLQGKVIAKIVSQAAAAGVPVGVEPSVPEAESSAAAPASCADRSS